MNELSNAKEKMRKPGNTVRIVILLLILLLSWAVIARAASSPATYKKMIASLDEKRETVMGLITVSTATAATITALPDDWGSPIADKIADLSTAFIVVLAALMLEKYLLTLSGYLLFRWIIPAACCLGIAAILSRDGYWKKQARSLAVRLVTFGLIFYALTPVSIQVSGIIENTHGLEIEETVGRVKEDAEELENTEQDTEEEKAWWDGIVSAVTDIADHIASGVVTTLDTVKSFLNNLIEAFAVFLVTTCIIPVIILIILIMLVKRVFGGIEVKRIDG